MVCWLVSSHRPEQALAMFLEVPLLSTPCNRGPCWRAWCWGRWQYRCDTVTSRSHKSPDSSFEGTVTENGIYISLWIEHLYLLHKKKTAILTLYNMGPLIVENYGHKSHGSFNTRHAFSEGSLAVELSGKEKGTFSSEMKCCISVK